MRLGRILAVATLLAIALSLVACGTSGGTSGGGTSSGGTSGNTITLQNIQFSPPSLSVQPGATVTVNNKDSVDHHIVIGTDDLGIIAPGGSASWTAPTRDGVYLMKCLIHPSMSGQITVGAGGSTVGTPSSGGGGTGY